MRNKEKHNKDTGMHTCIHRHTDRNIDRWIDSDAMYERCRHILVQSQALQMYVEGHKTDDPYVETRCGRRQIATPRTQPGGANESWERFPSCLCFRVTRCFSFLVPRSHPRKYCLRGFTVSWVWSKFSIGRIVTSYLWRLASSNERDQAHDTVE